jgi:D-glycero-beta-D-manno-heptose-7-phosphate kinase
LNINNLFEKFKNLTAIVVGDVMIDSYLIGSVDRISPEAPVPVVALKERKNLLGGAANVALNLKALGATPILCSVIGNDGRADVFQQLLKKEGITDEGLIRSNERLTTTKFRIIGNKTQMLRVDEEMTHDISSKDASLLLSKLNELIEKFKPQVIIIQDYDKGVLNESTINSIIDAASLHRIKVTVDPKKKNFSAYKNVGLFKPNHKELQDGLGKTVNITETESLKSAAMQLHIKNNTAIVMITLSDKGIFISKMNDGIQETAYEKAHLRDISDVSGAGDTVISVASLCLAADAELKTIAALSNLAGGLVCETSGVVPVDPLRLMNEANLMS